MLKARGLHVYLATTKKTYFGNDKYIEANAQTMEALKHIFSKDYLSLISHCDSAFTVRNTLASPKLQTTNFEKKESSGDKSDEACYMVQGNDSLEDTHLDDSVSSSNDDRDSMNAYALNGELSLFCKNLLNKYKLLKKKSFELKEE